MKYLSILNWVLLFFNAMMGLVLAVVGLMIGVYYEEAVARGTNIVPVLVGAALFSITAVAAGLCVWAGRKKHWLLWPAEGVLLLCLGFLYLYFSNLGN